MDDELAFIRAVQANPTDATVKLAYADWLEERGHGEKAEWLRLMTNRSRIQFGSPEYLRIHDLQHKHLSTIWTEMLVPSDSSLNWGYVTTVGLAHLQSALQVYARLNDHYADISYTFTAYLVAKGDSIHAIADQMGQRSKVRSVSLSQMNDWASETRLVLDSWLFAEFRQCFDTLNDTRLALTTPEGRASHALHILNLIRGVITPVAGWRYEVTTDGYYAIRWDEILLEGQDRVLYLGFQFDD